MSPVQPRPSSLAAPTVKVSSRIQPLYLGLAFVMLVQLLVACFPAGEVWAGYIPPADNSSISNSNSPAAVTTATTEEAKARQSVATSYGKLPLRFEANQGQTSEGSVKYLARGKGYNLFFTQDKAVLALRKPNAQSGDYQPQPADCSTKNNNKSNKDKKLDDECRLANPAAKSSAKAKSGSASEPTSGIALALELLDAKPAQNLTLEAREELPAKTSYFLGNNASDWKTGISSFARLAYKEVYNNIDLIYYGTEKGTLEYDFVVSPGASPATINVKLAGARSLALASDNTGDLVVTLEGGAGELRLVKPTLYQTDATGVRTPVTGSYRLTGSNSFGFSVGGYDTSRALTIDPVLSYSTYLGGAELDEAVDVAVDPAGYIYLLGETTATDFPTTTGVYQVSPAEGIETFVTKVNSSTNQLVYSTYLRSTSAGDETPTNIKVNSSGQAYIVGTTSSTSFPTTASAYQTTAPASASTNAYLAILNATGTGLVYSTYLGGTSGATSGLSIALYPSGTATPTVYIAGSTSSASFPTTSGAYQSTNRGGLDGYFVKINPQASGSAGLVYSTYLGGSADDQLTGVGVITTTARAGQAALVGVSVSSDFTTTSGAFQTSLTNPASGQADAIVAVVDPASSGSSALKYASYYGGSATDEATATTVDVNGKFYLLGTTTSSNIPVTSGVVQPVLRGTQDIFIAKFDPDASGASSLGYATYVGGDGLEASASSLFVGPAGSTTIGGLTTSTNLTTTTGAFQTASGGGVDGLVVVVNPTATAFNYATYLGGSGNDEIRGTATQGGVLYVAGFTTSSNFPVKVPAGTPTPTLNGGTDAFVAALGTGGAGSSDLKFASYYGGKQTDEGMGLAVDATGAAYVVGQTFSTDFPTTTGSYQTLARKGGDAYIAKLTPDGSGLSYSTYIGGSGYDYAKAVTVDASGAAYIVGETYSTDFPVSTTLQTSNRGDADIFVVKLNASGTALSYSTYLGGNAQEKVGRQVVVDSAGRLYLSGHTASSDYYTPTTPNLGASTPITGNEAALVAVLNPAGSAISYTVLMGGSSYETFRALAVDSSGLIYAVGETASSSYPAPGGGTINTGIVSGAHTDIVLVKLDPGKSGASSLLHASVFGGSANDIATRLSLDESTSPVQIWVTGYTNSTNLPTTGTSQLSSHGAGRSDYDSFIAKHNMTTSGTGGLSYSTYYGGTGDDFGFGIGVGSDGKDVFVTGNTASSDLPTTPNALQGVYGGNQDGYLARVKAPIGTSNYTLTYGTYLGGSKSDDMRILAVLRPSLSVYLAGVSYSQDFPVSSAVLGTNLAGGSDSVVSRFNFLRLGVITQPTTTVVNAAISPTVAVAVQNLDGSTYPSYTGSIVVGVAPDTGAPGAALGGTTSQAVAGGVASFGGISLNKPGIGYGLKFSTLNNLLDPVSSTSFDVITGTNTLLLTLVDGSPQSAVTGTNFTTPFKVRVTNYANTPQAGVQVTFTAPTSGASGKFTSNNQPVYTASSDANGYVIAPSFQANTSVGSYFVVATASGAANSVSFNLTNVSPPTPDYLDYTLKLTPALSGANPLSSTVVLTATLYQHGVVTVTNVPVSLAFSAGEPNWPGAPSYSTNQTPNGQWVFTYTRTTTTTDSILATANVNGVTLYSANSTVYWLKPFNPVSLDSVAGTFYAAGSYSNDATEPPITFTDYVSAKPIIEQTFPSLVFNPPYGYPNNTNPPLTGLYSEFGINHKTQPFTNLTLDKNGNATGQAQVKNSRHSVGIGDNPANDIVEHTTFTAILRGNFIVAEPITVTFPVWADDNLVFGIGQNQVGAQPISVTSSTGITNPFEFAPGSTAFGKFPVIAARNKIGIGYAQYDVSVYFPQAGIYPYEIDYYQRGGYQYLTLPSVTSNAGDFKLIATQGAIELTPSQAQLTQQASGITQTQSLTATLKTPANQPIGGLLVLLSVNGANGASGDYTSILTATTNSQGIATFTYTGTNSGVDSLAASAWISGTPIVSNRLEKIWLTPPDGSTSTSTGNPQTGCTTSYNWVASPANQSSVSGIVDIVAAKTLPTTALVQIYPTSDISYNSMITLTQTPLQLTSGQVITKLDTTLLSNGGYVLRIVYDTTENGKPACYSNLTLLNVIGENKPGRIAFDVTDFTVPVAGMPIVVGRTYDSLERGRSGDFGHGWNLSISSPKLEVNPAGDVTLTTLDGKRTTFFFTPSSSPFGYGEPSYTAEAGAYGSLRSNDCGAVASAGSAGGYLCFPGGRYNPNGYTYRDAYGRVYVISRANESAPFKLVSLTDLSGNTLSFDNTGIRASNQTGNVSSSNIVTITRDGSNRISAITGPDGKVYSGMLTSNQTAN